MIDENEEVLNGMIRQVRRSQAEGDDEAKRQRSQFRQSIFLASSFAFLFGVLLMSGIDIAYNSARSRVILQQTDIIKRQEELNKSQELLLLRMAENQAGIRDAYLEQRRAVKEACEEPTPKAMRNLSVKTERLFDLLGAMK